MGLFDFIEDEGVRTQAEETFNGQMAEVNDQIQVKIEEAVSGLKSKNDELLNEKKKISEKLKAFADIEDPELAREALKFIKENEDAQLIKDGKIEEVVEKRTSQLRADHEAFVSDLQKELEEAKLAGNNYKTMFENKTVDDAIRNAATQAGVLPEAIESVLLHGRGVFSVGKDGTVESRDAEGNLRKTDSDMIVNPKNWIESLKKTDPYFWPGSVGAGANAGGKGGDSDLIDRMAEAAKKGDMKTYRRLREKHKKLGK
jgi:hypothetical protein